MRAWHARQDQSCVTDSSLRGIIQETVKTATCMNGVSKVGTIGVPSVYWIIVRSLRNGYVHPRLLPFMSQVFPEDSLDCIEKLFAQEILLHFPEYGRFWERFIGRDFDPGDRRLKPRSWKFPVGANSTEIQRISDAHERIAMIHYGIFCHLAGAHFQISEARAALKESDVSWRYFHFWEAFEAFYQHLGNARNAVHGLDKCVTELAEIKPLRLLAFLAAQGHAALAARWRKFDADAQCIRDNIVHFARGAHVPMNGSFFIPLPVKRNASWSDYLERKRPAPMQEATIKMEADLVKLESLTNDTLSVVHKMLQDFLSAKAITPT